MKKTVLAVFVLASFAVVLAAEIKGCEIHSHNHFVSKETGQIVGIQDKEDCAGFRDTGCLFGTEHNLRISKHLKYKCNGNYGLIKVR